MALGKWAGPLVVLAMNARVLGQVTYPEGEPTPRYLTAAEAAWLEAHPLAVLRGATPPPTGPLLCPGEYAPMQGLMIAWEGPSGFLAILAQIGRHTTTTGQANLYVYCDTTSEVTSARNSLIAAGADINRVYFQVRTTDTIWIRDYGPRYVYEGNCRVIVDHTYNRPRPNDDVIPVAFASYLNQALYEIPLIHGGGNFHLDSIGRSYVTRLINNENPGRTELQIHDLWQDYQNVDTTFFDPFPTTVDLTQHIDMWMQIISDNAVMISDFGTPTPGSSVATADAICESAAVLLAARGYTVHRLPAIFSGTTHYTYTNSVICNNVVMIPLYSLFTSQNATALAAWQAALPGKTIVQINADAIVSSAGVFHCIVMHVPAPLNGSSPSAFLRSPRGGEVIAPGSYSIDWISDDDVFAVSANIDLSLDGGLTYPLRLATNIAPNDGNHIVTIPNVATARGRIRVTVFDGPGNSGSDASAANLTITGTPCPGDFNGDRLVNESDLGVLLTGWLADGRGDTDGDNDSDESDLGTLLANWQVACPP